MISYGRPAWPPTPASSSSDTRAVSQKVALGLSNDDSSRSSVQSHSQITISDTPTTTVTPNTSSTSSLQWSDSETSTVYACKVIKIKRSRRARPTAVWPRVWIICKDDDPDLFLKSLLPRFRALAPDVKGNVQIRFLQILNKSEFRTPMQPTRQQPLQPMSNSSDYTYTEMLNM